MGFKARKTAKLKLRDNGNIKFEAGINPLANANAASITAGVNQMLAIFSKPAVDQDDIIRIVEQVAGDDDDEE